MILNINNESFHCEYSYIISNLETLTKVIKGSKLYIKDNILYIDNTNKYFQGLYRWLYSQSRNDSLNYIESLVIKIKKMRTNLKLSLNSIKLLQKKNKKNRNKIKKKDNLGKYITKLIDNINNACLGLDNLINTYVGDEQTMTKIEKFKSDLQNI